MKKLLLSVSFLGCLACQPKEEVFTDPAARAAGQYQIQAYVINGDTLYTNTGVNKIGVSEFSIVLGRIKPDSVRLATVYRKQGEPGRINLLKTVAINEVNGTFQLSTNTITSSRYEGRIQGASLYERTLGGGAVVVPATYTWRKPNDPALEGIIISAQK